ncbi:MAG: transglutaminase-like domain-containing protein [Elusimicrobiota bacterium]|jgi:regulator of sirC expression with transglutaminase-like and TPR domain|nr:transglutaminase-like domain-containing protein [Elusimicrobiota bacterium]
MLNEKRIKALIDLIYKERTSDTGGLKAQLAQIIRANPQRVRKIISDNYGQTIPFFVVDILNSLRRAELEIPFKWYFAKHKPDLLLGICLIARFIRTDIKEADISKPLNILKDQMTGELESVYDIFDKASVFEKVLFSDFSFKLESLSSDIKLLCLPDIIKRRRATTFAMAVLYVLLAQDCGMIADIADVDGKPVVRMRDSATFEPVYIDMIAKGRFVGEDDCHIYASSQGFDWDPSSIRPMTNKDVVKRLLANLIYAMPKDDSETQTLLKNFIKL